jgi:GvpD gas vesicle protein
MGRPGSPNNGHAAWSPIPDPADRFSSGIRDLDRLLGGGFARGSMALFHTDATTEIADHELLFTPLLLNFLHQSNGIMAVLPARQSPRQFRARLLPWVGRRRFDGRVRVIDYVGEDRDAPYVVNLQPKLGVERTSKAGIAHRQKSIEMMRAAELAVRGARSRMFVELVAFEIMEMLMGPQDAARMFFHGIKTTRTRGNLCLGILRPGLGCADAVRGMADVELALHHDELGLTVRGIRPTFPSHLAVVDLARGAPHVAFLPAT